MKVRLTRVARGVKSGSLRTEVVEGEAIYPPRVGHSFVVIAPPLDPAFDGRQLSTSPVVSIGPLGDGSFTTLTGSRYVVDVLETVGKA